MKVAVVFRPDPDLGVDPMDTARQARSQGLFLDSDRTDVLLIYREYGDQFAGGSRTNVIGAGIWENVTTEQFQAVLATLGALPETEGEDPAPGA